MATAATILEKAASYIGTKESPANSNNVIFNTDYYGGEVSGSAYPWCCAFVWDIFRMCGASDLFYAGAKTAYCPTAMNWYKQQGQFYTVSQGGQAGDVVFFDWSSNAVADHIGFVKSRNSNGSYQTIEGNTSVSSNDNGGAVMERTRTTGTILGFGRPAYGGASTAASAAAASTDTSSVPVTEIIKQFQTWLNAYCRSGLAVDGIYGVKTRTAAIKAMQTCIGVTADGIWGAKSKAVCPALKQGSSGNAVYILQGILFCRGYIYSGFDGQFGSMTQAEVRSYQGANSLTSDGIAGKDTFTSLFAK